MGAGGGLSAIFMSADSNSVHLKDFAPQNNVFVHLVGRKVIIILNTFGPQLEKRCRFYFSVSFHWKTFHLTFDADLKLKCVAVSLTG